MHPVELLKTLNQVLTNAHIKVENQNDIILNAKACPGDVANCYRHRLIGRGDGAKSAYKEAKIVLYQNIAPYKMQDGTYNVYPIYLSKPLNFQKPKDGRFAGIIRSKKINVEHVWPQSKFPPINEPHGTAYQKSDLHILYPSKSHVNSIRSSHRFSENVPYSPVVDPAQLDEWNSVLMGNQIGQSIHPQSKDNVLYFMPIKSSRGRVARAMLYFAVRYRGKIDPISEFYIRKWHNEYPVTKLERIRNERVFKAQLTRNPFVDFPELVNKASIYLAKRKR